MHIATRIFSAISVKSNKINLWRYIARANDTGDRFVKINRHLIEIGFYACCNLLDLTISKCESRLIREPKSESVATSKCGIYSGFIGRSVTRPFCKIAIKMNLSASPAISSYQKNTSVEIN